MSSKKTAEATQLFDVSSGSESSTSIDTRRTSELIIGFVGPVASGVSKAVEIFRDLLSNTFNYKVMPVIKVSDIINQEASLVGGISAANKKGADRITTLQTTGNLLREKLGLDFLAKKCIENIATSRHDEGGYTKRTLPTQEERSIPNPLRRVHLIDSLKNPAEIHILREIYGNMFWLVGVFAPTEIAVSRLKEHGVSEEDIARIMIRDEAEGIESGQNVRKVFADADLFINNDQDTDTKIKASITRFLHILFGTGEQTLNIHESAMHQAASVATRSACLSRSVGAAIVSDKGNLISLGWNDAPKYGGGLYGEDDKYLTSVDLDKRCYHWKEKFCHNDHHKEILIDNVAIAIVKNEFFMSDGKGGQIKKPFFNTEIPNEIIVKTLSKIISETEIKSLIEFSRAVHAEMEAILSVARGNRDGLVGSSLYTTCFPCHNCARHIIAAGIKYVYFIEPYPKSRALQLHSDAITYKHDKAGEMVLFAQYEGVAPKNILKLFGNKFERKENGKTIAKKLMDATPLFQPLLDSFTIYEDKIVKEVKASEERAKGQH